MNISSTSNDVNILGGTYLQAWFNGINNNNAQGGYIRGAHVESNWASNPGLVSGQAGVRAIISGNGFSISDIFSVQNSSGQTHAVRAYVAGSSCAILSGGNQFGGSELFYIDGAVNSKAIAIGARAYVKAGSVDVTKLDGNRVVPSIASQRLFRTTGVGPFTPSSLQTVMHFGLASNITINAPSFTPSFGDELEFIFEQIGAGGNTVTWNAVFLPGAFVPTAAYGRLSTIRFRYISKISSTDAGRWVPIASGTT